MTRIKIKNFGPIKEGLLENDVWIDIKKVTMFIGNQGSGKSTVAKLISTFMWMEKSILNGKIAELNTQNFIAEYCGYFRLQKYFRPRTEINYDGSYCTISYKNEEIDLYLKEHSGPFEISKIMYVPAERSFLSSVEDAENVSGLPKPLFTFMDENIRSLEELEDSLQLPIGNYSLIYDSVKNISFIKGPDYELELSAASSGLHSLVPLYLVSKNISNSIKNKIVNTSKSQLNYRQEQRKKAELLDLKINSILEDLSEEENDRLEWIVESKYTNSVFTNIVEEPEQNLFPTSQREILHSLLEFNNMLPGNKLIMTTHSPYLINDLTLSIEAHNLLQKINVASKEDSLNEMVYHIVPKDSTVSGSDVAIYEMDETNGTISLLGNYKGLPSDENKLNEELGQGNELFAQLLEIRQLLKNDNTRKS